MLTRCSTLGDLGQGISGSFGRHDGYTYVGVWNGFGRCVERVMAQTADAENTESPESARVAGSTELTLVGVTTAFHFAEAKMKSTTSGERGHWVHLSKRSRWPWRVHAGDDGGDERQQNPGQAQGKSRPGTVPASKTNGTRWYQPTIQYGDGWEETTECGLIFSLGKVVVPLGRRQDDHGPSEHMLMTWFTTSTPRRAACFASAKRRLSISRSVIWLSLGSDFAVIWSWIAWFISAGSMSRSSSGVRSICQAQKPVHPSVMARIKDRSRPLPGFFSDAEASWTESSWNLSPWPGGNGQLRSVRIAHVPSNLGGRGVHCKLCFSTALLPCFAAGGHPSESGSRRTAFPRPLNTAHYLPG